MKQFAAALVFALFLIAIPTFTLGQIKPLVLPELKPLKGTPLLTAPKDPEKFTFILAGDNRPPGRDPIDPTDTVNLIFKDIKAKSPAFVLWTGDIIYGKDPENKGGRIDEEYEKFLAVAAKGKAAVYNAPGNHELDDKNNCPNSDALKLYKKDTDQPAPYGSFDYGNSHFIALDSDEDVPDKGNDCNCLTHPLYGQPPGYISANQMKLLKGDLEANKTKAHIFIFLHRPLVGYSGQAQLCSENVDEMQSFFYDIVNGEKKYRNVSYVVAGHQHLYYNPQNSNPKNSLNPSYPPPPRADPGEAPYYLVSGGAGAPLDTGGVYHYLVFSVDKATVKVEGVEVAETLDEN